MNYERYFRPALFVLGGAAVLTVLGVPVLTYLPLLIVLACPLMMFFMMRGMDHGGGGCHGSHDHNDGQRHGDDTSRPSNDEGARR